MRFWVFLTLGSLLISLHTKADPLTIIEELEGKRTDKKTTAVEAKPLELKVVPNSQQSAKKDTSQQMQKIKAASVSVPTIQPLKTPPTEPAQVKQPASIVNKIEPIAPTTQTVIPKPASTEPAQEKQSTKIVKKIEPIAPTTETASNQSVPLATEPTPVKQSEKVVKTVEPLAPTTETASAKPATPPAASPHSSLKLPHNNNAIAAGPAHGAPTTENVPSFFKEDVSTASYGVGFNFGDKLRNQQFLNVDYEAMVMGIKDAMNGDESKVAAKELYDVFVKLQADAAEEYQAIGQRNLEISKSFMIQNEQKRGLLKTPSGLQYEIIEPGTGASPQPTDTVLVHYIGRLIDGRTFDDTKEKEEPATVDLANVIEGWKEALPMMKQGARWVLYVPPELGYGMETPIENIPPNAVLIFEIELLDIKS